MMQAAIDRVMHTYGMLVNLTLEQEKAAREKVTAFLAQSVTQDENLLAVEGIKFLRGDKALYAAIMISPWNAAKRSGESLRTALRFPFWLKSWQEIQAELQAWSWLFKVVSWA